MKDTDQITQRDAVVSSMVFMHDTIRKANAHIARRQGRQNYISPRHFLDFIQHYVSLYAEKKAELEDQQLHLNIGLRKLTDTQEQVAQLNVSLTATGKELELKTREAEEKLKKMVAEQQIAEQKRVDSVKLSKEVEEKQAIVATKQEQAQSELGNVCISLFIYLNECMFMLHDDNTTTAFRSRWWQR